MRSALPVAVREEWDAESWAMAQVGSASAPALVARGSGALLSANAHAETLLENGELAATLRTLVAHTCVIDRAQVVRLTDQGDEAGSSPRSFDLTLLPVPCANVLVVAREVTLEANLIGALTASRELFRDLALCSTDFAFETDATGVFAWASPSGALGYSAAELHGAAPRDVFGNGEGLETFSSREPVRDDEIRCATKSGGESCIALTVVPVIDARGQWCGARGVARDITALRLHERAAAHAKRREELIGATVGAMRGQIEPRRMMMAAADALLAATGSQCVTIRPKTLDLFARVGDAAVDRANELSAATSYQGQTNGTVCLARQAGEPPYAAEERALVDAVVPHLGIAIALAESLSAIASQSRTDPLTGLLNRRGFFAEAARRMGALARAGRSGALLLIDCDDFKAINDTVGPLAGDELLCGIGQLLSSTCRTGDTVARIGSDEFALLLDEASLDGARKKAEHIHGGFPSLCGKLGFKSGVTLSLGVAFIEPDSGISLDDLMAHAGGALAAAKREGRDRVAIAEPSKKVMSC